MMSGVGGDDNRKEEMFAKQRNFFRENKKVYQSHIKQRKKVVLIFQRLVMKMKDLLKRWSVNQGGINSCVDSHCDLADICTNSRMGVKTSKYFSGGL